MVQTAAARRGPGAEAARVRAGRRAVGERRLSLMDHVDGTSVAPRVLRREELEPPARALPAQLGRGARPDPLDRRAEAIEASPTSDGDPALAACALWEATSSTDRRAAAGRRGRAPLAAAQPAAPAERARPRPRRLPARQPDRRRARPGGGDRLGAVPRRATRPRTSAGSASARGGSATTIARSPVWARWRSCSTPTRRPGASRPRSRADPVVGGDGQRQVGGDLRPPGARPPDRPPPRPRACVARTPDLRARMGSPAGCLLRSRPGARSGQDGGLTQDRPTAPELLDALAEFLFSEVREWVPREQRFQVLVLAESLRGHRARASRRGGAARARTWRCSASSERARPPTTRASASRDACARGELAELGRRAGRALPEASAACASTSRRKLDIARPGYAV